MRTKHIAELIKDLDQTLASTTNNLSLKDIAVIKAAKQELSNNSKGSAELADPQMIANVLQAILILMELMKSRSS